ncbi:hypothetical protein EJP67_16565 [Variovorax guangxiensis]|uniref:Peptidase S11 D-alanyl-D-alanine carboxypeptidase A N-terminal domain-containing protein n=1 Tax=Variovorax guangxiensis TaxID=1775474 RepID=A0A3S0Z4U5_9BURK|nr:LamG-like jellyroll fold domain-containing protein [Variovorax guangxiensis]RUR68676.1 hypothetical protein EJP67_16565 [Variovorax guangxiensis]
MADRNVPGSPVVPTIASVRAGTTADATTYGFSQDISTAQQPASLTKLMTAYVMRQWIDDGHLDDMVTVTSADTTIGGNTAGLQVNDVVTYRHLLYGALLPSGNDAANAIARGVGAVIIAGGGGGSDPTARFVSEMNTQAAALGMSTAGFYDAYGLDASQRLSVADVMKLMLAVAGQPLNAAVAGTQVHTMVVTGSNARTYNVTHTIDKAGTSSYPAFPEMVFGKTGYTAAAQSCVSMMWRLPTGGLRVSTALGASSDGTMFADLRKLIDYEIDASVGSPTVQQVLAVFAQNAWIGPPRLQGGQTLGAFTQAASIAVTVSQTQDPIRGQVETLLRFLQSPVTLDDTGRSWTAFNQAQLSNSPGGRPALLLDGGGDYLQTSFIAGLDASAGAVHSEVWIYPTVLPTPSNLVTYIYRAGSGSDYTKGFVMGLYWNGSTVVAYQQCGTGSDIPAIGTTTIPLNQWTHLYSDITPNGSMRLFVNGVLDAILSSGITPVVDTSGFWLGVDPFRSDRDFSGYMRSFRAGRGVRYPSGFTPPQEFPVDGPQGLVPFTQAALVLHPADRNASVAQSIDGFLQSASAAVSARSAAAQAMAVFSQASNAAARVSLTSAQQIGTFLQVSQASVVSSASASQVLQGFQQVATVGPTAASIAAAQQLEAFLAVSTAQARSAATAAQTLGNVAQIAVASSEIQVPQVSAAQVLGAFSQHALLANPMAFTRNERTYVITAERRAFLIAAEKRRAAFTD